jgi:kynureninase
MSRLNSIESAVKNVKNRHKEKFKYFLSGWYGWEKWFQVELAYELSKNGEASQVRHFLHVSD